MANFSQFALWQIPYNIFITLTFNFGQFFRLKNVLPFNLHVLSDGFDSLFVQASEEYLQYPGWALAVLALLIIFAMMPVPVALIHSLLQDRTKRSSKDTETGQYSIVNTDDNCETPMTDLSEPDQRSGTDSSS